MFIEYSVGDFVTHPQKPDWGTGQVQSVIGSRITVNFEHAGKQLINAEPNSADTCRRQDRFGHKSEKQLA